MSEKVETLERRQMKGKRVFREMMVLNQVYSSFEESKSFEFDGRLNVLVVVEVL